VVRGRAREHKEKALARIGPRLRGDLKLTQDFGGM
jgi:hypothetical protein